MMRDTKAEECGYSCAFDLYERTGLMELPNYLWCCGSMNSVRRTATDLKFRMPCGTSRTTGKLGSDYYGNQRTKTGARTEAEHWEKDLLGHWTWLPYKARRVYVKYWLTFYAQNDCGAATDFSGEAFPWDQKNVEVQHTHTGHVGWFKINSRHELHTDDGHPPVVLNIEKHAC